MNYTGSLRAVIVAALCCLGMPVMAMNSALPSSAPPARDGNIAIMEEFQAARAKRSIEGYDLFIARHPQHPLAALAQGERDALLARRCK
jgi:hypothetical protein